MAIVKLLVDEEKSGMGAGFHSVRKAQVLLQAALHPLERSLRPSGQTMPPCFFPIPNTLVL